MLNLSFCISTFLEVDIQKAEALFVTLELKTLGKDEMLHGHHDALDTWWIVMLVRAVSPILIFKVSPQSLPPKMLAHKENLLHSISAGKNGLRSFALVANLVLS